MADEVRVVTPIGYLKVEITVEEVAASTSLAFTRTGIEINQEGAFYENIILAIGEDRLITLKEGLYKVRAFIGKLYSEWVNTEIKNGELTSRIFHFGKASTK